MGFLELYFLNKGREEKTSGVFSSVLTAVIVRSETVTFIYVSAIPTHNTKRLNAQLNSPPKKINIWKKEDERITQTSWSPCSLPGWPCWLHWLSPIHLLNYIGSQPFCLKPKDILKLFPRSTFMELSG